MKNYLLRSLLSFFVLLPPQMMAAQSFGIGFGLPTVQIIVQNNTEDGYVATTIDDKSGPPIQRGGRWARSFGTYNNLGQIAIFIQVCSNAKPARRFNAPPDWTVALEPSIALSDEYLNSNPSKSNLKARVQKLESLTHDQLGGKLEKNELKAWFKTVSDQGIVARGFDCESPIVIPATTFQWNSFAYYSYSVKVIVNVVGNRRTGYQLLPPQYVQ